MGDYHTVVVLPVDEEAFEQKTKASKHPNLDDKSRQRIVARFASVSVVLYYAGGSERNVPADCLLYACAQPTEEAVCGTAYLYGVDRESNKLVSFDLSDYRQMRFGLAPVYELHKELRKLERLEQKIRDTLRTITSRKRQRIEASGGAGEHDLNGGSELN